MTPQVGDRSTLNLGDRPARPDVRLRPGVEYRLFRPLARDIAHWMPKIRRLIRQSHEGQLLLRSNRRLQAHMRRGEMVLLIAADRADEQLVGLAIAALNLETDLLEIAHTVVHPEWRGERLAMLLYSGALICQALNQQELCPYITLRPDNEACAKALVAADLPVYEARHLLGSLDALDEEIIARRRIYWDRGWDHDPLIGIVTPEAFCAAARLMLLASRPGGLRWTGGSIVKLVGTWADPGPEPGERFLPQLNALADGELPTLILFETRRWGRATRLSRVA